MFLRDTWKSYLTVDGSAHSITYDVIGPMGVPSTLGKVRKATLVQINNEKVTDATAKVKLSESTGSLVVDFEKAEIIDMPWTSHIIMFELESPQGNAIHINKTFEVKTAIVQEIGVSLSQNSGKNAPEHYQFDGGYPREFNPLNTNDNPILHMQI